MDRTAALLLRVTPIVHVVGMFNYTDQISTLIE